MNELQEYQAKKQGKVTPIELAKNLYEAAKRGEIESIAYVTTDKDGEVAVGWTEGEYLKYMGMLEAGKITILDEMNS